MTREDVIAKWSGETALKHLHGSGETPSGCMAKFVQHFTHNRALCDVGCGIGRVAPLFDPGWYIGIDLNGVAIAKAKEEQSEYPFEEFQWGDPYPQAGVYLFWTVLLHVPDNELSSVLSKACVHGDTIIIVETMDAHFRRIGPDFQRNEDDYEVLGARLGYEKFASLTMGSASLLPRLPVTALVLGRKEI